MNNETVWLAGGPRNGTMMVIDSTMWTIRFPVMEEINWFSANDFTYLHEDGRELLRQLEIKEDVYVRTNRRVYPHLPGTNIPIYEYQERR